MANCTSIALTGVQRDCGANLGGVKQMWLIPDGKLELTYDSDHTKISNIAYPSGSTTTFSSFAFKPGTAYMNTTLSKDATNGSLFWTTEAYLQFPRMETAKRVAIKALAEAECQGVIKDSNGKYWFIGQDEPVEATAGTGQTGTAKTDGNFYSMTLTDNSLEPPMEVDATAFETLIG